MVNIEPGIERRSLLCWLTALPGLGLLGGVASCQPTLPVYDLRVSRDVGCSCCHAWTELMEKTGRFNVTIIEVADLPAYKSKVGVPAGLGSCHTALADGLVVEGHVPAEDVLKLLEQRPAGVKGIAVPGMPRGSPGMEQPNGVIDSYTVVAFDAVGVQRVFSYHGGNA